MDLCSGRAGSRARGGERRGWAGLRAVGWGAGASPWARRSPVTPRGCGRRRGRGRRAGLAHERTGRTGRAARHDGPGRLDGPGHGGPPTLTHAGTASPPGPARTSARLPVPAAAAPVTGRARPQRPKADRGKPATQDHPLHATHRSHPDLPATIDPRHRRTRHPPGAATPARPHRTAAAPRPALDRAARTRHPPIRPGTATTGAHAGGGRHTPGEHTTEANHRPGTPACTPSPTDTGGRRRKDRGPDAGQTPASSAAPNETSNRSHQMLRLV